MGRISSCFSFVLAVLCLIGASRSSMAADTVAGPMIIVKDTKEEFKAIGSLTSTDPDTIALAGPVLTIQGVNWSFLIDHDAVDWRLGNAVPPALQNGADDATIEIDGTHIHGPHPAPAIPHDIDPNPLVNKQSKKVQIPFDKSRILSAYEHVEHLTSPNGRHHDHYAVRQDCTALEGPPNLLTGPTQVFGKHTGSSTRPQLPFALTMGSSSNNGSRVTYDAGNGHLTIHPGALDILNRSGVTGVGIAPDYLVDAILGCQLGDVTLQFIGPTLDGGYRFGGAHTSLFDPQGALTIEGDFSEYLIYDTSQTIMLDSYAFFDAMTTAHGGETCRSKVLDDLVDIDMFGETLPEPDWLGIQGILYAFITQQNLAALTGGFSFSVFDVPATVVTTAGFSPEPVTDVPHETGDVGTELGRNYPNPFAEGTTIHFRVGEASPVRVEIFDPAGRLVRRLADQSMQPGQHSVTWNGTSDSGAEAAPGIYYYRVSVGTWTQGSRMVLVR